MVENSKHHADIIIPHGGRNSVAINLMIAMIESVLSENKIDANDSDEVEING